MILPWLFRRENTKTAIGKGMLFAGFLNRCAIYGR